MKINFVNCFHIIYARSNARVYFSGGWGRGWWSEKGGEIFCLTYHDEGLRHRHKQSGLARWRGVYLLYIALLWQFIPIKCKPVLLYSFVVAGSRHMSRFDDFPQIWFYDWWWQEETLLLLSSWCCCSTRFISPDWDFKFRKNKSFGMTIKYMFSLQLKISKFFSPC